MSKFKVNLKVKLHTEDDLKNTEKFLNKNNFECSIDDDIVTGNYVSDIDVNLYLIEEFSKKYPVAVFIITIVNIDLDIYRHINIIDGDITNRNCRNLYELKYYEHDLSIFNLVDELRGLGHPKDEILTILDWYENKENILDII